MSFTDRLKDVPSCNPADYISFVVEGIPVGLMKEGFVKNLADFPDTFQIDHGQVVLSPKLKSHEDRTHAVARVLEQLHDEGKIPGWRNELYPVATHFHAPSLFYMERAATPLFGVRIYAVNLNGFVRTGEGTFVWIARRSMTKQTAPGKLDMIVSGGHPAGMTLRENLMKECGEEANIPIDLAEMAISVGGISFRSEMDGGVLQYLQFNFDLELPENFTPQNTDGEVQEFALWPVEKLMERVRTTDDFAADSALVMIDFMIRHGFIEADHPEYDELLSGLRTDLNSQQGTDG